MLSGRVALILGLLAIAGCTAMGDQSPEAARLTALEAANTQVTQKVDALRADLNRASDRLAETENRLAAIRDDITKILGPSGRQGLDDRLMMENLRKRADAVLAAAEETRRKLDRICFYQQPGAGEFLAPCKK